MSDKFIADPGD